MLLLTFLAAFQSLNPAAPIVDQWRQAGWVRAVRLVRERAESQDTLLLSALQRAAKDSAPELRRLAAWGLSLAGTTEAADTLRTALKDPDPGVRWFASYSLARLAAVQAIPGLREIEQSMDQPTWVAAGAAGAIARISQAAELAIGWARARSLQTPGLETPALYKHPPVRRAADAGAACRSEATGVAELLVGIRGEAEDVRLLEPLACAADNQAYFDSVRTWRFRPARLDGQPVAARFTQTLPIPEP